jgi:eukaryotic-like serine/threonine-protein kinase
MTTPQPTSVDLLLLLQSGDEAAAEAVFERYAERLTRLARSRLAIKLARRVDPEDIVQSAYRSFFVAAREGRFHAERGGDLWRLLVEMTLHKLYRQAAHHGAQRRSVAREVRIDDALPPVTAEPTPDEAAATAEELEAILRQLAGRGPEALELRLQGNSHEEIAEQLSCSVRTVRRWLADARRIMSARAGGGFVPSAARKRPSPAPVLPPPSAAVQIESPLAWSDFLLHEQIGAGATGKVYRATWRSRQQDVAVKFLRKSLVRQPAVVERFLREAQTVAQLADPGIVAMHGAGRTAGGGYFLVLELVRGPDLDQVSRDRPVNPDDAVRWVAQAARIIHRAHELGVIHCDLKPSNLLLDEAGQIRVTDFGLAVRLTDGANSSGLLAGTPAFMAPEQVDLQWGEISPRTDVYGLGAVLFFLLFGRPPFVGADLADVFTQVAAPLPVEIPVRPDTRALTGVIEVMRRCLAKRPQERFATTTDLGAALDGGAG